MIQVRNLTKRYGDVRALGGIDLAVPAGQVVAVLGPNGAGKTSLVEILEGFRRPDGGTVRVLGVDPATAGRSWRARIGVLLQTISVEPQLTAREAVTMYAGAYPRPRDVAETLDLVDLTDVADRRAGRLSGGQQRRLDLATALVGRPDLLFLDEPTTGFDPHARRRTWEVIRGTGATVVLTTHYLDEAAHLADRVVVIAEGRVVADGEPATLGGHDIDSSTIRFRWPPDGPPSLRGHVSDGMAMIRTSVPTAVLAEATGWAVASGVELGALTVTRPSLEDIYLSLTTGAPSDPARADRSHERSA